MYLATLIRGLPGKSNQEGGGVSLRAFHSCASHEKGSARVTFVKHES